MNGGVTIRNVLLQIELSDDIAESLGVLCSCQLISPNLRTSTFRNSLSERNNAELRRAQNPQQVGASIAWLIHSCPSISCRHCCQQHRQTMRH